MKRALIFASLAVLLAVAPVVAESDVETTILSFNIRYGRADDGPDSWEFRRDQVCETIAAHAPAVFGVQECLPEQAEVLREAFPGYEFTGVGRDDGKDEGEMCAIFTDRARYEVLDSGTFWLSEDPEEVGSRSWDAALPRIATWVKLLDRTCSPGIVFVFNTHFDHVGVEARIQSAHLLKERIPEIAAEHPVILMGDFNANADGSQPYRVLTARYLKDTWTCASEDMLAGDSGTFHDFTGETSRGRIDWILASDDLHCSAAGIDRVAYDGRYPSDHYPVWARFRQESRTDLAGYIDPFIGTGGHGHTFPGPTLPFGMVQLSPDTRLTGWDGCSIYHDSDRIVFGFSHTHLSGTGVDDYGDVLLMPVAGKPLLDNGYPDRPDEGYGSRFDKAEERAEAGYYRTFLKDYGIEVELTATKRTGLHRYVFPAGKPAHVIVDLEHRDKLLGVGLEVIDERTIAGFRRSEGWARDQLVHFRAVFSKPFTAEINEPGTKAVLSFGNDGGEVLAQVAISAVDSEGARKNLETEWVEFDFEKTRSKARHAWSLELLPYEVEGATEEDLTVLAAALYHSFIAPNLFSDVDGRYRGMDREVHLAEGRDQYTVFSLWDTYRATHPLFTLVQRERTPDLVNTALSHYQQSGRLPVWELAGNETDCMIGYHSVSFIADAWLKGIRGFDADLALEAMVASANEDHFGLDAYKRYGFIPADVESESVSRTLEYSYDDACIARLARGLDERDIAETFGLRAHNWRNLFDPESRCFRPRRNGQWYKPFDPRCVDSNYTEANAWQYRFGASHHMPEQVKLLGGESDFVAVLDSMFTMDSATLCRDQADITGRMGQYAHGNEPSHHIAWLYHFAAQPQKSADRVGAILREFYSAAPDGLIGNEDCGQMSSWYVLSAYGLYDVAPTSLEWLIVPPLHPEMSITFEGGSVFTTRREGSGEIESVTYNDWPLDRSWLRQDEVTGGGELVFVLSEKGGWKPLARPGAMMVMDPPVTAPWTVASADLFREPMEVEIQTIDWDAELRWSIGEDRDADIEYTGPITLSKSTDLHFRAKNDDDASAVLTASFRAIPIDWKLEIDSVPSMQYTGGGPDGLIDGRRGNENWRTGGWHGYEAQDFVAMLDLGKPVPVAKAGASFLQDVRSWIMMPLERAVETSLDGEEFVGPYTAGHVVSDEDYGILREELAVDLDGAPVRYLRFRAKSYGPMPDWHLGAGGKSFIFVDELIVETGSGGAK